ncbi:MAG: AsmA family protein, partial [Alphaproteobacteria bacterium]|nr:AsmA family protein [Alphaproteobacteria bacterium]
PGALPSVGVNEVLIDKARLTYRDAASGQKLVLGVKRMRLRGGTDDPLEMEIDGDFNKAAFRIDGRFGPIAQLLKGREPWPLSVDVKAGGATVGLKGTVAEPLKAANLNVKFSVAGKDLSELSGFAGAPVPPLGPYAVSGRLRGRPDTAVTVSGLSAKMGKSALSGGVKVNLKGRPAATVTLKSDFLDLADFVKPADGSAKKKSAAKKAKRPAGEGKKKSNRLFPADPLPLEGLRAADVALDLKVKKLLAQGINMQNLTVKLGLRDGDLSIKPLAVGVAKGTINSQIRLNARQATPKLSVKLSGKKIAIGKLLAELGIFDLVIGTVNTEIDLSGRGNSVRKLMAGLNGKTSIVMGKGRMRSDALDGIGGGAVKVVTGLVFGKKSAYTVVNCFVNRLDVKKGVAKSVKTVFDTEHAAIIGMGNINLGTERITFDVDPKPKSVQLNAAVPLQIRGTLAKPTYKINKLAAAAQIGGLVESLIKRKGVQSAGASTGNPCLTQAAGGKTTTKTTTTKKQPTAVPSIKELKEKSSKEIGKEIEKGLKGLFGR